MRKFFISLWSIFFGLALSAGAFSENGQSLSAEPFYVESYPDPEGRIFNLKDFRGQWVLVNFWARWCSPCRQEIPDLVAAYARYRERGLMVVGIALEDGAKNVADFARAYEINYPVLLAGLDNGLALAKALGNDKRGVPYSVVIDKSGSIVFSRAGVFKPGELDPMLDRWLANER